MISTAILIPARYESTRFPGKPLVSLDGKTMIDRVVDACKETGLKTVVLTDDIRIHRQVMNKCMCIMHHDDYQNGTERCAGAISDEWLKKQTHFINVQGDMPDITPEMIFAIKDLIDSGADVATVYTDMDPVLKEDPNTVKMIKGTTTAQWFGRGFTYGYHHLGVYGYTREALTMYPILKKTQEEDIEKLEQLRWIKNGWQIAVNHVQYKGVEINSPEDVKAWQDKNSQ